MSVSAVSSSSYQVQWPALSGVDSTDKSGAPSDPLLALFGAFSGGGKAEGMGPPSPPPDGSAGSAPQFSSSMMSAMISMLGGQGSGTSPLDKLIGKFDTDSDGKISQTEFEDAAGASADKTKADALFAKMDADGDGSVTKEELAQAIQKAHGHHHHHHVAPVEESEAGEGVQGAEAADGAEASSSGGQAKGPTRQSVTNADGSITTTITYGDGSKLSMTTAATSAASASDSTSRSAAQNGMSLKSLIEKMVAMQAQMLSQQQATTSVSV